MKIITFVVPCYNSEKYMSKCLDSLLPGGDDIEILIINDGSSDGTAAIADRYESEHPDIVRVIHKENGGHGSGINSGLKYATGEYFKVIDSDDWVDAKSLEAILTALKMFLDSGMDVDMLISNYVYEHVEDNTQNVISYTGVFPESRVFEWEDMIRLDPIHYIIMHSVTYRTRILRESGLVLPEHIFYVDNMVLYVPLPYVKKLYYLNTDFYRYYIGRSDQSVNEKVMIGRVDQQLLVTNLMLDAHDLSKLRKKSPKLAKYMVYYLSIMYTISTTLLALDRSPDSDIKRCNLWARLKDRDVRVYKRIRYFSKAFFMSMPGYAGKKISAGLYRFARKVYKFN